MSAPLSAQPAPAGAPPCLFCGSNYLDVVTRDGGIDHIQCRGCNASAPVDRWMEKGRAAEADEEAEDVLDVPMFLRRQAD